VCADGLGDFGDETHAVVLRAAILVGALIGAFGEELVHEIAVRAVQLQHLKAGLMRASRGLPPGLHQVFHLVRFQGLRHRPFLAMGDRARRHRLPRIPILDI
jgi:hypothetical protein